VRGTGYALELPNSWVDEAEEVKGSAVKADLAYADPTGKLPHKNIVVVRETPKGITEAALGQVDKVFRGQATALATSAGVSPTQDRTLAGAKAKTYTYVLRQAGGVMRQRQVFTIHDGAVYTISWTAPARSFESTIPLLEKVLASWRWT